MSFFIDDAFLEMPRGPHPWGRRFQRWEEVRSGLASRFAGIPDAYTARTVIGSAAQRRQTVVAATVVFPDQRRAAYDPRWERRLRAGLLLDATMAAEVVQAGLGQPIMWITRDADTVRLDRRRARAVLHPAQSAHPTSSSQTCPDDAETVVGA